MKRRSGSSHPKRPQEGTGGLRALRGCEGSHVRLSSIGASTSLLHAIVRLARPKPRTNDLPPHPHRDVSLSRNRSTQYASHSSKRVRTSASAYAAESRRWSHTYQSTGGPRPRTRLSARSTLSLWSPTSASFCARPGATPGCLSDTGSVPAATLQQGPSRQPVRTRCCQIWSMPRGARAMTQCMRIQDRPGVPRLCGHVCWAQHTPAPEPQR